MTPNALRSVNPMRTGPSQPAALQRSPSRTSGEALRSEARSGKSYGRQMAS